MPTCPARRTTAGRCSRGAIDWGKLQPGTKPMAATGTLILAYDDEYSVEYNHQKLRPWWRRDPG